jgi:molybdopterin adenylyltransferase
MSSWIPEGLSAAVITVSDSCARGERVDISGPAVADALRKTKFSIVGTEIVADEQTAIEKALTYWSGEARLVVTTGGTGIAARDVTPEAARQVCERQIDGVAERMRLEGSKKTPFAVLSRAVCGVRGNSIILTLPGNPAGAVQSLESVLEILPHALDLLGGKTGHV